MLTRVLTILFCTLFYQCFAHDTIFLKVHFLYGSKPLAIYKKTEPKWFGGILGGHVGIEIDSNKILSFLPNGKFHWFAKSRDKHSSYITHSFTDFYSILGGNADSVKKTVVFIPITSRQKEILDSIANTYLAQTPYDYAFMGMRCGAATYEILGKLDIVANYSYTKTYIKIFYPAKLRRILLQKAFDNNWKILVQPGSFKRKWERD